MSEMIELQVVFQWIIAEEQHEWRITRAAPPVSGFLQD